MTFDLLKELDSGMGSTLGDYKFLYGFISLIRPHRVLDIGTNHGLSAIIMAMALRDSQLQDSKVFSVDINPGFIEIAKKQIEKVNLSDYIEIVHGTSADVGGFFDVVFIDGAHTFDGCLLDFENVRERSSYILIHDVAHLKGISRAVDSIATLEEHDIVRIDDGNRGNQWSRGKIVYHSYPGIAVIKVRR